jgi:CheY-like chemotaxis protein
MRLQLSPNLSPVMIDVVQFETALLNLVTNARDAISDGGVLSIVTDDVTLREHETGSLPAGRYVEVIVRNHGVGMTPDVLEAAVELFKMLGYDVLSANNATDAIDILKRNRDIDVLFSDVVMPDMNGIMLAREARKLVPGIAVLLASGYPAPMLGEDSTDIGDFQFISKPYRMAEIVKRLRAAS